ncbi:TPA: AlpA family phage regulatory protein [Vibrio parahaemolyticus]|uniref:helix-turn-helix transcriptional regulator n=1 Tax=Vibrio parahaemolyticus TaxID=670 RepID=UPI00111DCD57|nr:AlpA family phage regulatory protein [Vibrio parahaemolyticus]MDF4940376.1 AlpA family phage regulatory protein [Vibrio parahaemolyticus]TOK36572.1 transcriptional regulator [Vibrio parahaemolyticus]HCE3704262.1 AlpA family phage regulatory protein [Vibrio parahaemolyticus]HCG6653119.1 AlpA family phage regulatory protein [Vibrio parahaemolyticus]
MSKKSLVIRYSELAKELGVSTSTLWRWRQNKVIPEPISLGPRLVVWERVVIEQWLESKRTQEIKL